MTRNVDDIHCTDTGFLCAMERLKNSGIGQENINIIEKFVIACRREELAKHIQAGAKNVILSAPTKSNDIVTVVHGVNRPDGTANIIACASCTEAARSGYSPVARKGLAFPCWRRWPAARRLSPCPRGQPRNCSPKGGAHCCVRQIHERCPK